MKRIISLCSLMAAFFLALANPVEFKNSVPENGSTITSWDFELQFDITKALETAAQEKPNTEVGLGVFAANSSTLKQYTTLYKGDELSGEVLGIALTSTIHGKSPDFKVNGNTVKFSFDNSIPIVKGQKYTVKIENDFYLYIKDKATRIASTKLNYKDNPLILSFYGGDLNGSQLFVESCSLESNTGYESINELTFNLNSSFTIADSALVSLLNGENEVATTSQLSISGDNERQLKVEFDTPVDLYSGRTYTIHLPSGVLLHKNNPTVSNTSFDLNITGTKRFSYGIIDYTPKENQTLLPETASITFDVPEGKTLLPPGDIFPHEGYNDCKLYPEGNENDAVKLYAKKASTTRNSFTWDLSNIAFIPSTKYYIKKEQGSTSLFDTSGNHCPEYRNEGITFSWTTPSIEEMNLPVIPKACYGGSAKLGKHDDPSVDPFVNGGTYSHLSTLEIALVKAYEYNGEKYNAKSVSPWKLYDVTSGERVFIKDLSSHNINRETTFEYYSVAQISINADFYQGHTYEIVLEKDGLTIPDIPLNISNYLRSEEVVFTVVGSRPTSVDLLSKNISDNEELDALYMAVWVFNGDFQLKDDANVELTYRYNASSYNSYSFPLHVEHLSGRTYVSANFMSSYLGTPLTFTVPANAELKLPAGILTYAGDETVANKEIITPFKAIVKQEGSNNVRVSLTVNGVHTTVHEAIKGNPYTFTLNHDSNWVVESVTHNGVTLAETEGSYTTEPLTKPDNDIKANLKFAVEALVDGTTGVAELPDSNIAVTTDSDKHIVISGLVGNENLAIYSMNGLLVKDFAADGKNIYHVSVDSGIYIVLVVDADGNRKAAKVQVK